ncbi:hypothetical protein PSTG_08672 [Puccinia striiformis f. sp. tritici PST-78]|nr:hypothetical protein PSTG_08672 [Puccinia striiformis f. sp. tritici PST-78]
MALAHKCPPSYALPVCLKVRRINKKTEVNVSARKGFPDHGSDKFGCQPYADTSHDDELLKAKCCSGAVVLDTKQMYWATKPVPPTLNDDNCIGAKSAK